MSEGESISGQGGQSVPGIRNAKQAERVIGQAGRTMERTGASLTGAVNREAANRSKKLDRAEERGRRLDVTAKIIKGRLDALDKMTPERRKAYLEKTGGDK